MRSPAGTNRAPARSKLMTAENGFPDAAVVIVFHRHPVPSHFGPGSDGRHRQEHRVARDFCRIRDAEGICAP
jgi:hypothetical protein